MNAEIIIAGIDFLLGQMLEFYLNDRFVRISEARGEREATQLSRGGI